MVYAGAKLVLSLLDINTDGTPDTARGERSLPAWRQRLEKRVCALRADVSRLTSFLRDGSLSDTNIKQHRIHRQYKVQTLDQARQLLEHTKMQLEATAARIRRYKLEATRRSENRVFVTSERQFYRNMTKSTEMPGQPPVDQAAAHPSAEAVTEFWSSILEEPVELRGGAWLDNFERDCEEIQQQDRVILRLEDLRDILKKSNNWKAPGRDKIHAFWWKKFPSIHERIVVSFQSILDAETESPAWFSFGITTLLPKKGDLSRPENYRPITCLPTISKIFTSLLAAAMWRHLSSEDIFADEQVGCTPGRGGCLDQLMIDKMVLEDAASRSRNLSTCWVDFRKAFDSLSHQWIRRCLLIYRFADNLVSCISSMMDHWRTQMVLPGQTPRAFSRPISIHRGIFQGDSLSPLLFCLSLNPISGELTRTGLGYRCGPPAQVCPVSHLWYMDDIKLFARNDNNLLSMTNVVESMGDCIGMRFNPSKSSWLTMKRGRAQSDQQSALQTLQGHAIAKLQAEESYRYLGVPESAHFHATELKTTAKAEFGRRLQLICSSQLNARNLVKAINTFAIPVILYSLCIVEWTKAEIEELDRQTRQALFKAHARHPKDSAARVHLPRDMGGRGILSFRDLLDRTRVRVARYLQAHPNVPLLAAVKRHHDNDVAPSKSVTRQASRLLGELDLPDLETATKVIVKKAVALRCLAVIQGKPLHGQFWRRASDAGLDLGLSFRWLKSPTIRPATEGLLLAVQDQAIATRHYQVTVIGRGDVVDICRVCGTRGETVDHIVACCPALAKTLYIERHDTLVKLVHWALCKRHGLGQPGSNPLKHHLVPVTENPDMKLLWEFNIPTDTQVRHNRPDLVLRSSTQVLLMDVSVPLDQNVPTKIAEKITKYAPLCQELRRIWHVDDVRVVPQVVGALGGLTGVSLSHFVLALAGTLRIERAQQCAILGTLNIIKSVLGIRH